MGGGGLEGEGPIMGSVLLSEVLTLILFFKKYLFIYLVGLGLSCSRPAP